MKKNKKIKNNIKFVISVIIISIAMFVIYSGKEVNAAYYSANIENIDENKYPGYKENLVKMKALYPNIQLFYTELDWNTVINNQRVHSRNLVPRSYEAEWRCLECGDKLYDTGWYCASREAIEYIMDPRDQLNAQNIFQFQKLNTNAGTLDRFAIQTAARGTFLEDWDCVVALYDAANNNNVNAFHLLTRTIQEQGRTGTSALSSGAKFAGTNGIEYEGLYNLFSIGATGSNSAEVRTNGLERARQEGWTTRAKSIAGGGKFVKEKYIDRNQNTLYFQKFDVDSQYDGLYWHQYMQNVLGAKNEGLLLYDAYNATNLVFNREFEFIIPIYENMPKTISERPTAEYYGEINTEVQSLGLNGNYILGEIHIAEWVNGVCNTPRTLPKMTLKTTDGSYESQIYVKHKEGINYYYDKIIKDIDYNKEYYIEVELTSSKNLSTNKVQNARIKNMQVGTIAQRTLKTVNNKLVFSAGNYVGDINTQIDKIELNKTENNSTYISGEIDIAEWINGECMVPKALPKMMLKSTDGKFEKSMFISYRGGIKYYYDIFIEGIDISKEYYIEARLTSEDNISNNQIQTVRLPEKELGKYKEKTIKLENDTIKIIYSGEINTQLQTMKIGVTDSGAKYIYGNIKIEEWIDGKSEEPKALPKMMLKSTDGQYSSQIYVSSQGGLNYYFDKIIKDIDVDKQYYIEASLTSINNISENKNKRVTLEEKEVGQIGNIKVVIKDNNIQIIDTNRYLGEINTQLQTMKIGTTAGGAKYIYGNIVIAEWINGECMMPKALPKMTLKSSDGSYASQMHVSNQGGLNYYYDRVIEGIDTNKEYYIEVELTHPDNQSNNQIQRARAEKITNIGMVNQRNLIVENNIMKFLRNEYFGEINTQLQTMKIGTTVSGAKYIYGNIVVAEWINGECMIPKALPKMTLKSLDGSYSSQMYVSNQGGLNYYYDRVIEGIDTNKEYYIEVELTHPDNQSNNQIQRARAEKINNIGTVNQRNLVVENNIMKFIKNEYFGEINTELQTMKIGTTVSGAKYIYGNIVIAEWINGECMIPKALPKMMLKSTDGQYSSQMYVSNQGGLNYYYDRVIEGIDTSKEYYIEVELTHLDNKSNNQIQRARIKENQTIGVFGNCIMKLINNIIIFENTMIRTTKEETNSKIVDQNIQQIEETSIKLEQESIKEELESKEEIID